MSEGAKGQRGRGAEKQGNGVMGRTWINITPHQVVLLLALICGTLYLVVVPPWQHYDEPTHFEYAWLIANRQALPQPGDYDQAMRREVAASMLEHDFFRGMTFRPDLAVQDRPVWIGISELRHAPFYYLLAALPLRLLRHTDITFQLYVARFVSLLLYLLSIWIAARLVGELVPAGHPLRWAVPGIMALLPAYTDLMTAVNNDVGATVVFSLFLWGAVRTIVRGASLPRLLWIVITAALCVWTKNTAAVAVLLAPLALILALARGRWSRWAWIGSGAAAVMALLAVFSWGDAALWYRGTLQETPTGRGIESPPLGRRALALETVAAEPGRQVNQPLLREDVAALQGQTVTLGAWMWADHPVQIRSPMLFDGRRGVWQAVEVDAAPTFHAFTATVAANADANQARIILRPLLNREQQVTSTVYYDGLVLVAGEQPPDSLPAFDDPQGREGTWGGRPFVNFVRNGSAEAAWPWVRPWVDKALRKYARRSPAQFLGSVLDWQRTGWVWRASGLNLFQSFWARFGWNHVGLADGWYWGLGVVTVIGIVGALVTLVRQWRNSSWPRKRSVVLLIASGLLVWGNAFLRSHPIVGKPFIPGARYAYPVIVPTVLTLTAGLLAWAPSRARKWVAAGLLSGIMLLNVVSLVTIWTFYGR